MIFTAAGVLITVSTVVLSSSWKHLLEIIDSMPNGYTGPFRDFKTITDEREKDKYILLLLQFFGCLFFIGVIALSVIASGSVAADMLGYKMGYYQQSNYEFGKGSLFVAIVLFSSGYISIGFTYLDKIASVIYGKPELLTARIEDLPPITEIQMAKRNLLSKYSMIFMFLVLLTWPVLDIFTNFNNWIKIFISLLIITLYFIGINLLMKLRFGNKRKKE